MNRCTKCGGTPDYPGLVPGNDEYTTTQPCPECLRLRAHVRDSVTLQPSRTIRVFEAEELRKIVSAGLLAYGIADTSVWIFDVDDTGSVRLEVIS